MYVPYLREGIAPSDETSHRSHDYYSEGSEKIRANIRNEMGEKLRQYNVLSVVSVFL